MMLSSSLIVCLLALSPLITAWRYPLRLQPSISHDSNPNSMCGRSFIETWHQQPVDHFNFQQHRFYQQRVLVNRDDFDKENPVIFFYTGNEGDIEVFANNTGFMCDIAPEFHAMLVFAEHRYFGKSMPFGDDSYQPERLGYLSVEQAMADFAQIVVNIKAEFNIPNAGVIAFGGSYGGMLSAWIRMKYPHVVDGAIASSAPILQFTGMAPTNSFDDIVTNTFESSHPGCSSQIRSMFALLNSTSLEQLTDIFNLCEPLQSRSKLIDWISNALVYEAMVDYPIEANFIQPLPAWPVNATCSKVTAHECHEHPLQCFAAGVEVFYNYTGEAGQCNDVNGPTLTALKEDGWNYLACTSMVMPSSSESGSMFPAQKWDLLSYTESCYKLYGIMPNPGFAAIQYGGDRIWAASNIVFSNGELDPWSGGGVLHSSSPDIVTVLIQGAAHHLDLRGSDQTDSQSLKDARSLHKRNIKKWIDCVQQRNSGENKLKIISKSNQVFK